MGAVLMGSMVFLSQFENGIYPATTASTKQFFYTFLISSVLIAMVEAVVVAYRANKWNAVYGVMTAWVFTSVMSAVLHTIKGTPDPMNAILLNILLAPPGLIFVALRKKRELRKEAKI